MLKRTTLLLAAFAIVLCGTKQSNAQTMQGESVVTVGLGWSLVGALFGNTSNATTFSTPAFLGHYDYALGDKFSLGAAFSYQSMGLNYTNYTYTNNAGVLVTEDIKSTYTRTNIGIRPLFHFGDNSDMDMYAGVRLGYQIWKHSHNSSDATWSEVNVFNSRPTVQPLFGIRYFFTDLIGFNAEIGLGSPYVTMAGINLRF